MAEKCPVIIPDGWDVPATCPKCGAEAISVHRHSKYITHDKVVYACISHYQRETHGFWYDKNPAIREWRFHPAEGHGFNICLKNQLAAAVTRAEQAEAQARAMRDAIETLLSERHDEGEYPALQAAITGDAGRALIDELKELRELKRRLEALPDNTCLQHSEGWEHGNDWFVLKDEGADRHMGMGKTPLEALRQAQKGDSK